MGSIERKGSENLAKSGATAVDQSNLGPPPWAKKVYWGFPSRLVPHVSRIKATARKSGELGARCCIRLHPESSPATLLNPERKFPPSLVFPSRQLRLLVELGASQ